MASSSLEKAVLTVPESGYKGQSHPVRGRLVGHEGEWFRVGKKGRKNYRVVRIGIDGRAEDTSYRVVAGAFELIEQDDEPSTPIPDVSVVSRNGAVVIATRLRDQLDIREGTIVTQEKLNGGVWIRPVDLVPRQSDGRRMPTSDDLERLVSQITPENVHGEFDTGDPVGREML